MRTVQWPWPEASQSGQIKSADANKICPEKHCSADDARRALSTASNYCARIIRKHDGSNAWFGTSKVAISTIGALSGSVVSQLAQGSAAKAWSGVSGVANGMNTQLDQAFSGALDIRRKQLIATAASDGVESFLKTKPEKDGANLNHDARVEQAMKMALACAVNGAKADATAMQLLTGASPVNPPSTVSSASSFTWQEGVLTRYYTYPNSNPSPAERLKADAAEKAEAEIFCGKEQAVLHAAPSYKCMRNAECQASVAFKCRAP